MNMHPKINHARAAVLSWWEASRFSSAYDVLRDRPVIYKVKMTLPQPTIEFEDFDGGSIRQADIAGLGLKFGKVNCARISYSKLAPTGRPWRTPVVVDE